MPTLTRRRDQEALHECWQVFFGDVCVGTISKRAGVPSDADQWGWTCGFFPLSHHGRRAEGIAMTFDRACAAFEAAWREYLPNCTDADFEAYRRQQAWTRWKFTMQELGRKLPTEVPEGRSRCFCGAVIDVATMNRHVSTVHMVA